MRLRVAVVAVVAACALPTAPQAPLHGEAGCRSGSVSLDAADHGCVAWHVDNAAAGSECFLQLTSSQMRRQPLPHRAEEANGRLAGGGVPAGSAEEPRVASRQAAIGGGEGHDHEGAAFVADAAKSAWRAHQGRTSRWPAWASGSRLPAWASGLEVNAQRVAAAFGAPLVRLLQRAAPYEGAVLVIVMSILMVCLLGTSMLLIFASRVDVTGAMPETAMAPPSHAALAGPGHVDPADGKRGTAGPRNFGASSFHLCPGLVVPPGSECYLAVLTVVNSQVSHVEFDVLDLSGKAVLRAEVARAPQTPRSRSAQAPRTPTVLLKTLPGMGGATPSTLAYCCGVPKGSPRDNAQDPNGGAHRNVYIYRSDDELFAHLMKDESTQSYVLTSGRLGLQLLFEGIFNENVVNVSNEKRELLAATEPQAMDFDPDSRYYKLRVASGVDVGLVLCGLLAINQAEIS